MNKIKELFLGSAFVICALSSCQDKNAPDVSNSNTEQLSTITQREQNGLVLDSGISHVDGSREGVMGSRSGVIASYIDTAGYRHNAKGGVLTEKQIAGGLKDFKNEGQALYMVYQRTETGILIDSMVTDDNLLGNSNNEITARDTAGNLKVYAGGIITTKQINKAKTP